MLGFENCNSLVWNRYTLCTFRRSKRVDRFQVGLQGPVLRAYMGTRSKARGSLPVVLLFAKVQPHLIICGPPGNSQAPVDKPLYREVGDITAGNHQPGASLSDGQDERWAAASPSCWALLESELELKLRSRCVSQPRLWGQTDLDSRSSWLWRLLAVSLGQVSF